MSLALQPLSAGNSAEFSQADNSKTIQGRVTNLTSLYSLGSCESIYVYLKPKIRKKYELNHFKDNRNTILDQVLYRDHYWNRVLQVQFFSSSFDDEIRPPVLHRK